MNIEKMKAFAQAQRESEESTEIRPAPKPAEPEFQPEAIYIPIEDDEPSEMPDDGFAAVSNEEEPELPETETIEDIITTCFPEDKSYNIELDRLLPLRSPIFTDGGDLSELSSSIARMGITEPLLVRSAGNGEYEILSGNRHRAVAEQLMWVKVPCRIGDGKLITDEYARRIIVETNRQRFPELTLSEQIRVSAVLGERAEKELGITSEQSELFGRLNSLEQEFLLMLDSGAVSIADAEILCGIKERTVLLDVLKQHPEMKLTSGNIRELSGAGSLTEEVILEILKPKPPVMVAVPAEIISEYLGGKTAEEISEVVSAAVRKYCS